MPTLETPLRPPIAALLIIDSALSSSAVHVGPPALFSAFPTVAVLDLRKISMDNSRTAGDEVLGGYANAFDKMTL